METAFFNTTVECPICKKENRFETIRVGAYVESGRDTDFCPKDIKWRFPEFEGCNPLVFFVATCENCLYSREFNDTFKNWQNDTTFKTYRLKRIKERHLEELAKDGSIIKRLGEMIDLKNKPDETAIAKLLLAIFDEQLNERPANLDMGRLYIRIGWVFRGLNSSGAEPVSDSNAPWPAIDSGFKRWKEALQVSQDIRQELFGKLNAGLNEKTKSAQGEHAEFSQMQEQTLAHESKLLDLADGLFREVEALCGSDVRQSASAESKTTPDIFGKMAALKQQWDGVPLNEREALQMAAECYKSALEEGKEVSAGNQQIQVCYLIAELSRRFGDHEQAQDFFNSALKVGQQFVRRYQNDKSRTALARKILELTMDQSRLNREAMEKESVS